DVVRSQSPLVGEHRNRPALDPVQTVFRSDPEHAVPIDQHRRHIVGGQAVPRGDVVELTLVQVGYAARGANPHAAGGILGQPDHAVVHEAVLRRVDRGTTVG